MPYELYSRLLKGAFIGGYIGTIIGVIKGGVVKGDGRSLDSSSYGSVAQIASDTACAIVLGAIFLICTYPYTITQLTHPFGHHYSRHFLKPGIGIALAAQKASIEASIEGLVLCTDQQRLSRQLRKKRVWIGSTSHNS